MIILLLGSTLGSFSSYTAQEIIPRGEVFHIQKLKRGYEEEQLNLQATPILLKVNLIVCVMIY